MESAAAVAALTHLGIPAARDLVLALSDGANSFLRADSGSAITILRKGDKYDVLVVGAQADCPVPALRAVLETAVLPLSDDYAARIGVAPPERDALRKRIREASVALDVIAKGRLFSVAPPEIPFHEEIKRLVSNGAKSVDDLPERFVHDLATLNQLQANVVVWSKEVDRVVQISKEGPGTVLTAEEETVFWSSLDAALSAAQQALSSRTVKISLEILARKRRATGFLIDATSSLDAARRKAAGVLTLIQGLPIVALRTAEDLPSLRKAVVTLLEHVAAKLRISSFSVERVLSLIDSMGSDVNRSIGRILAGQGGILVLPYGKFVDVFESCCELFEAWSQGFDHCRKVAREAARKKGEAMPPRGRSPLSNLYSHLSNVYELRADHNATRAALLDLSSDSVAPNRIEKIDVAFATLVHNCRAVNHFELGERDEAVWDQARISYKSQMTEIEMSIAEDYVDVVRRGRDLHSLAVSLQPFRCILDKQFMARATSEVIEQVLRLGVSDIEALQIRRHHMARRFSERQRENIPAICIMLSECRLLSHRISVLLSDIESAAGKTNMEVIPEMKDFVAEVEKLSRQVNSSKHFAEWLNEVDLAALSQPLLSVTRHAEGIGQITCSVDSNVAWFFRVVRLAKENADLSSQLTNRHQEFSRVTKNIFPIYSCIRESLNSFNLVSDSVKQLNQHTHARVLSFLDPVWTDCLFTIEEGFKVTWDRPTAKLQEYASRLLEKCLLLWDTFHTLVESENKLESSRRSLISLVPVIESGHLSKQTLSELQRILTRISSAKRSLCDRFEETRVDEYFVRCWIQSLDSALSAFADRLSQSWFLALRMGRVDLPHVVLDTIPGEDSVLCLSLYPTAADVELFLYKSLGLVYLCFTESLVQGWKGIRVPLERDVKYVAGLCSTSLRECSALGRSKSWSKNAAIPIHGAMETLVNASAAWNRYVGILDPTFYTLSAGDQSLKDDPADLLEKLASLYEGVSSLRGMEDEQSQRRKAVTKMQIRFDSRILSGKIVSVLRDLLVQHCDRIASEAAERSQELYKKISTAVSVIGDASHGDPGNALTSLQTVKEDVLPFCRETLKGLLTLESKFENLRSRIQDAAFSNAESTETWILSESLFAHLHGLEDLCNRRSASLLANQEILRDRYVENKECYQAKLASLFADFQSIRSKGAVQETFLDWGSLVDDLEHQLKLLVADGADLERMGRALGLRQKLERSGPKEILQELEKVKKGMKQLSLVEEKLAEISGTPFKESDPAELRSKLTELSLEVEGIANSTGAKREAGQLRDVITRRLKDCALLGRLWSVRLSPPRERELLQRWFAEQHPKANSIGDIPLASFWDANLVDHEEYIRQVLDNAAGEASVSDFLAAIESTWTGRKGTFQTQGGIFLLQGIPGLLDETEECLQALETMSGSHFAKLFEADRATWETRLGKSHEDLELLQDVQGRWAHLRTLFGSELGSGMYALKNELREEFAAFSHVHARFSALGEHLKGAPGILEGIEGAVGIDRMNSELQAVVRGLSRFLEGQRTRFPRYFFLSDDDLLQVLSTVPSRLESLFPHIAKMFPGVSRFEYRHDAKTTHILKVVSKEGEILSFQEAVCISDGEPVSSWLTKIESRISCALKDATATATSCLECVYTEVKNKDLLQLLERCIGFPVQIILLSLRVCFTRSVEECLSGQEGAACSKLDDILCRIENFLTAVLSMDKSAHDRDTRLVSLARGQFIKELVYQRDRVKILCEEKVRDISSHLWNHQLRAYSLRETDSKLEGMITLRCGSAEFSYGWEYLGVGETLVHTELTSRCFLILCESLRGGYGGSPFGPAGTGKTETVKALGRVLGRFVAVFNCDESFDSVSVGRILAGVCRMGCWVCFDEFNRLSSGILSSTSTQLAALQTCITSGEQEVDNFYGGDLPVAVKTGVGVFVTMNPTYTGRRELPANLKSLFRPCAMSKPDSVPIAEVLLLSYGFVSSSSLARKLVNFFSSLRSTLSQQPHYDFGLRALKSTIVACGTLIGSSEDGGARQEQAPRVEEDILIRAIEEVIKPKLDLDDILEYEEAVRLVFTEASCLTPRLPENMESMLNTILVEKGLGQSGAFLSKIRQLYWLLQHQRGVILLGSTGSGKSTAWRTLFEAMKRLGEQDRPQSVEGSSKGIRSSLTVLDPKLFSVRQLYGDLDPITREWTDGLLTGVLRRISEDYAGAPPAPGTSRHWIVFDGDVDPDWAENLNSVLDDNRILTLPNGEQIPFLENTRILFETEDLSHANPSTVSRCGMICFGELNSLQVSLQSSLQHIVEEVWEHCDTPSCLGELAGMIVGLAEEVLRDLGLVMQVPLQALLRSFLIFLRGTLFECTSSSRRTAREVSDNVDVMDASTRTTSRASILLRAVLVATGKGLGAGLNAERRVLLSQTLLQRAMRLPEVENALSGLVIPSDFSDVTMTTDEKLVEFKDFVPDVSREIKEQDIGSPDLVIPTPSTVRLESLLRSSLELHSPKPASADLLLLCGPPGCGKSMLLTAALRRVPNVSLCSMSFSSETRPENVIAALKGHMMFSKMPNGTNVMHPKSSGCHVVLFCDEVNLEKPDLYGTQRTASFLRGIAEHGGFWDCVSARWVAVKGLHIAAACNPEADAGRHKLPSRLLRHCNLIRVEQPNAADLKIIYGVFMTALLSQVHKALAQKAKVLTSAMVGFFIGNKNRFCPTGIGPLRPHYIYSPRELSRWVRGMKQILFCVNQEDLLDPSSVELSTSRNAWKDVVSAFCYEARRLFRDRLLTDEERQFAETELVKTVTEHLNPDRSWLVDSLYTSWMGQDPNKILPSTCFRPVRNPDQFRDLIYQKLRLFAEEEGLGGSWLTGSETANVDEAAATIDQFAVTDDVLTHLTRIERVLCSPLGHAVLLGAPGTGKKTLTRFAAWMLSMDVHQVRSHSAYSEEDFANDLRRILRRAGVEGHRVVMIFDESNAMDSGFLEMMNSLLACGEVPGLFSNEERSALLGDLKAAGLASTSHAATETFLYSQFVSRVRKNLHIIFTMSSASSNDSISTSGLSSFGGDDIARRSPALYNRCNVNWIGDWAQETLEAVAELKIEVSLGQEKDHIIRAAVRIHGIARQHFRQLGTRYVVTPRHFLEFVEQINRVALEKGSEIQAGVERHREGLRRLRNAGTAVDELKDALEVKTEQLQEKEKTANEMLRKMVEEQRLAEKSKMGAEQLALAAAEASSAVRQREEEVAEQLASVQPNVEAAREAVGSIRREYLEELRAMPNPPSGVRVALEGVMMVLDESNGKGGSPYTWGRIRGRMRGSDFITCVVTFDAQNFPKGLRRRMESRILRNPEFNVDKISYASRAAGPLAEWTLAVLDYATVVEAVEPLQAEVRELEEEQAELLDQQRLAAEEVDRCQLRIEKCKEDYATLISEAERVRQEIKESEASLIRSEEMLDSLADEWDRWIKDLNLYNSQAVSVWGNAVYGAAFLAYGGALDHLNRRNICSAWKTVIKNEGIPFDADFEIADFLTSSRERGAWSTRGIPTDKTSLENYAILRRSARYPLIVDPTRSSSTLLRNVLEAPLKGATDHGSSLQLADNSFDSIGKKSYMRGLESAMRFGTSLFLDDAHKFDRTVTPLLGQEFSYGDAAKYAESLNAGAGKSGEKGRNKNICQRVVRLGEKDVFLSPSFRMYLAAPSLDSVPLAAITRSNIVSFELSPDALGATCVSRSMKILAPEFEERRKTSLASKVQNQEKKLRLEDQVLSTVNNVEDLGSELLRGSLLDNLSSLKEEVRLLEEEEKEEKRASLEIERSESAFEPLGKTAVQVFNIVRQLAHLNPLYIFDESFFLRTFENAVTSWAENWRPANKESQVVDCQTSLLKHAFTTVVSRLFPFDRLPYAAALSLGTARCFASDMLEHKPDETIQTVLGGWQKSVMHMEADAQDRLRLVRNSLPKHMLEQMSAPRTSNSDISPVPLAGLEVLKKSLHEPHRILESVDDLACTLPDHYELVHGNSARPEAALRSVMSNFARSFNNRESKRCEFPPMLLCAKGDDSDPATRVTEFAGQLRLSVMSVAMGSCKDEEVTNVFTLASRRSIEERGTVVILKNMHLASLSAIDRLHTEITKRNGNLLFLLTVVVEVSSPLAIHVLRGAATFFRVLAFETLPSFRGNLILALEHVAALRAAEGVNSSVHEKLFDRLHVLLSWLHACLLERSSHFPVGFTKQYEFTHGDLSAAWKFASDAGPGLIPLESQLDNLICMLTTCAYGARLEADTDRDILHALVKDLFTSTAVTNVNDRYVKVFEDDTEDPAKNIIVPVNPETRAAFVRNLPLEGYPEWSRMPAHTAIGKRAQGGFKAMQKVLRLHQAQPPDLMPHKGAPLSEWAVVGIDEIARKGKDLPSVPMMSESETNRGPVSRFWLAECRLLSQLVATIKDDLQALSDEDMAPAKESMRIAQLRQELRSSRAAGESLIPRAWVNSTWPSGISVRAFFTRVCQSIRVLRDQASGIQDKPVDMSAILRPKALFTALLYEAASSRGVTPHSLEPILDLRQESSDGVRLLSGIRLNGAEWDVREKCFVTSDKPCESKVFALNWKQASEVRDGLDKKFLSVTLHTKSPSRDIVAAVKVPIAKSSRFESWRLRGVSFSLQ